MASAHCVPLVDSLLFGDAPSAVAVRVTLINKLDGSNNCDRRGFVQTLTGPLVGLLAIPALHASEDQSDAAREAAAAMEPGTLDKDLETARNFRAGVLRQMDEASYRNYIQSDEDGSGIDYFVSVVGTALAKNFIPPTSDEPAKRNAMGSVVRDQIAGQVPLGGFLWKLFPTACQSPKRLCPPHQILVRSVCSGCHQPGATGTYREVFRAPSGWDPSLAFISTHSTREFAVATIPQSQREHKSAALPFESMGE